MSEKIKIAFDLDGVIIDKPPLIPKNVIEILFRGSKKRTLKYKIPKSKIEILIRKLSHFYLFRPPLNKNIEFIKKLKKTGKYKIYIITGRYSFLKNETADWLRKRRVQGLFDKVFMNEGNEQPCIFKEKVLGTLKPKIFVDDDKIMVDYLSKNNHLVKFFYLPYRVKLSELKILR